MAWRHLHKPPSPHSLARRVNRPTRGVAETLSLSLCFRRRPIIITINTIQRLFSFFSFAYLNPAFSLLAIFL